MVVGLTWVGDGPSSPVADVTINICLGKEFTGGDLVVVDDASGQTVILPQVPGALPTLCLNADNEQGFIKEATRPCMRDLTRDVVFTI
jgi:hypothetical protein